MVIDSRQKRFVINICSSHNVQPSGSQTGLRSPFGVRETIFWGSRSTFQKNQHDATEEKNFV